MRRLLTGFILLAALFIGLNARPIANRATPDKAIIATGSAAPEFTLTDLNSKSHSLKDYRGKTVVVSFISARCPISNAYKDRIRAIADEYAKQGVVFLGVNSNSDESVGEMRTYAARNKLNFTILKDKGNVIADAYSAERTPKVYVIDGNGLLQYQGRI